MGNTPNPILFAASAIVAGVLLLVAFVGEASIGSSPAASTLISRTPFLPNAPSQTDLALLSLRSFGWALFALAAIPFFALVGRLFRHRNADVASIATLLSVVGATLFVLREILQDSALAAAGTVAAPFTGTVAAPSPQDATYQVALVFAALMFATANALFKLGAAMWGLGFILFGVLTRNSGILPNWMAVVAIVGGVAGWAMFPVLNTTGPFFGVAITEVLLPGTTAIWCFACAVIFLRRGRATGRADEVRVPAG